MYWDATGRGRWYIFEAATGIDGPRKARRTVAGPEAKLSELHSIIEMGESTGTVEWVCAQYHDSAKFKGLAAGTRDDYEAARNVLINYPTILGVPFGKLQVAKLRNHNFQRLVDKIESAGTPTKANKVLRYSRLVFRWALNRGIVDHNPAQGLEQAKERKRQRLPTDAAYAKLLAFAHERSMRTARTEGSVPPYLWMIMELGYLCRLRGIETLTLTEAQGTTEGLHTNRRKRSRDNLVEWTPRLRRAWDAAIARREAIIERHAHTINIMTATLKACRGKGRLMHSNFLWLKPTNRTLWYALCGQGGQSAYWEAAGPWAHGEVEELLGKRIVVPMVAGAVEALRELMSKEHWIDPGQFSEAAQQRLVAEANAKLDAEAERQRAQQKPGGLFGGGQQQYRPPQPKTRKEDDEP
ncbi:MAG: hypothetical protein DI592_09445 [Stenotrophomonas maltophilia]|nr:MAG: hypothetical protein DI592_09445 [Stenotrophomonas maltophilia]